MATRTNKGILLAEELLVWLRKNNVIIPAIDVVERTCAEAMAVGDKIVFQTLNAPLTPAHRDALDRLLESSDNQSSRLTWLCNRRVKSMVRTCCTTLIGLVALNRWHYLKV